MGPKRKTPLSAKQTKVTCRYCGPEQPQITRQYYPEHLVHIHNDHSGDAREHGQQKLTFGVTNNNMTERVRTQTRSRSRSRTRSRSREMSSSRSRNRHSSRSRRNRRPGQCMEKEREVKERSVSPNFEIFPSERRRSSSQKSRSSLERDRSDRRDLPKRSFSSDVSDDDCLEADLKKLKTENTELKEEQRCNLQRMEDLCDQADNILEKAGISVDVGDCSGCGYKQLIKKLGAIEKFVASRSIVKDLEKCFMELKVACSSSQPAGEEFTENIDDMFRKLESVEEIVSKFPEFEIEGEKVFCKVCAKKITTYSEKFERNFRGINQKPLYFRSFKVVLKRHLLNSEEHKKKLQEREVKEDQEDRVLGREKRISKVLGDVCFFMAKKGRPYSDFPLLLNILSKAGVDVGDINHSEKFPLKFSKELEQVIMKRVQKYLSTPLSQTGQKPPVKGVADKATYKHDSRMYAGVVTVVPDSPDTIQGFITTAEVCPGSSGKEQSACLIQSFDSYFSGSQVQK